MHPIFKDATKKFVVTLFIQEDDFESNRRDFEDLGNQRNIKLVVQPCPFEAIEFLYRIDFDIKGHVNSLQKSYFWQALPLSGKISQEDIETIAQLHHAYLVAIVQNDTMNVKKCAEELQLLL